MSSDISDEVLSQFSDRLLAVARNRVRRVVRESFRHNQSILGRVDIVVMAQTRAAAASNPDLRRSLEQHWDRIRRTPPKPAAAQENNA